MAERARWGLGSHRAELNPSAATYAVPVQAPKPEKPYLEKTKKKIVKSSGARTFLVYLVTSESPLCFS